MSDPLRPRAEDEQNLPDLTPDFPEQDIRTRAQQSLERNQQEVQAIKQSGQWTDGMDPKAIKMAKSRDPREARQGQREMQRRQVWNQQAQQKIADTAQQEQQLRAREQQAAADQARAEQVRRAKQAGAVTEPDPATGRPSVKLHPDGTPVSKRGPVGQPVTRPTEDAAMAAIPGVGTILDTFSDQKVQTTDTETVQRYRDDRWNEIEAPLEQKTDPKTGERYIETKDAYGRPTRKVTGVDPNAQKKLQLEQESAQLDLHSNALETSRIQNEPRWSAVEKAWNEAQAEWNKPAPYVQENGRWVMNNDTRLPADPMKVEEWKKSRTGTEARYQTAKRRYEAELPAKQNLEEQKRQIALKKIQIDSARTRLEHNLPEEDGGVAEGIAKQQTGQVSPEQQAVIDAIGSVPGMGGMVDLVTRDDNWSAPTEEKPLVPQDDEGKRQLFLSAFQGLKAPETYTLGASGKGYTFIQRNGANIGSLDVDQNGDAAIVLNRNTIDGADLLNTIAVGTVKGTPIYLAEGAGTRNQSAENQWVTSIYQTYRDDPAMEDATYATNKLKELRADPATIMRRVNAGHLSLQRGEALMRDLYGTTLKAEDPTSPATFEKWLSSAPKDVSNAWAVAKGQRDTAAQNEIRKQYLNEWFVASRSLPGITMGMRREAEKSLTGELRTGEKAAAVGQAIVQAGGSMLGAISSPAAWLKLQGQALLTDDNDITVAANEQRQNLTEASKNTWRNWDKNVQQWTTPEGKARKAAFGTAAQDLQAWIESQDSLPGGMENPDWKAGYKARIDAVTDAALQLHELNQQDGWEITRADLDPSQNQNLAKLVNGYALTGDRSLLDQYLNSLTVDHGSREYQTMIAELTEGRSPFMAGVIAGAYAPPEEILVEIASTALTGVLSSAVFGGAKAAKAAQVVAKGAEAAGTASRINRFRRYALGIAKEAKALGMVEDTLAKPASALGKAQNFAAKAAKVAVPSALGEGAEEAVMAAADPNATQQSIAQDAAMGAVMGLFMTPVIGVPTMIAENSAQAFKRAEAVGKFAAQYNRMMADTPGFRALSAKDAEAAMALVSPERKQALLDNARTAAASLIQAVEATKAPNATGEAHNNLARAQAASLRAQNEIILGVIEPVEAVASLQSLDPAQREFGRGILKVASGRADLLTPAETTAIQARKTPDGSPYFENRNGIETVTPAGRADLLQQMPAIGRLVQTTASQQIANQALEGSAPQGAAPTDSAVIDGPNYQRVPITPEVRQQAADVVTQVMQAVTAQYPQIASRVQTMAPWVDRITGGAGARIDPNGNIVVEIIPDDIAHQIAVGATPEQMVKATIDNIVLHETLHTIGAKIALDSLPNDPKAAETFYGTLYQDLAKEAPQSLVDAREMYGAENWDTLTEWQRAAEYARMLAEAKIAGRTTDVHRLTADAPASLLQKIADIVRQMIEAITTGQNIPESVKQHVEQLAELYNELLNAPATSTTSPADPANNPAQPPASSQDAGDSPAAQEGSDPVAASNVRPESAPSDPSGAPAQPAAPISPELTNARRVTAQVFTRIIGQRPILRQDKALIAELDDVAFDLADQIVGMPEAKQVAAVENALNAHLMSPEVSARRAALEKTKADKERAYREIVMRRIRAEADRVIGSRMKTILKILTDAGRIQRPPNILPFLARQDTLSDDYQATKKRLEDYAAWPKVSDYPGGGKNAVIRAIIQAYMAPDSDTGVSLDDVDQALGAPQDEIAQLVRKELDAYARGADGDIFDDPDAELTDAQIEEGLKRNERDLLRDKWRQATGKREVLPQRANAYEEAYQRIVAAEGENEFLDEEYMARAIAEVDGPKTPKAPQAAAEPAATPTGATQAREALNRVETEGSTAPLNPRVEGLEGQSVTRGDLMGKTQPLAIADLQAIQRNGAGITALFPDGPLKRTVESFVSKVESMLPPFQGNKTKMAKYVASAILRYWTKAQRESVTTFYDLFAGGGAWGLALADTFFPNVNKFVINEFDTARSIKVREQMINGHRFAEAIQSEETQTIIRGLLQDFAAITNDGATWGAIYKTFEKWSARNANAYDDTTIAIMKMLADDPTRGAPSEWGNPMQEIARELDGTPVMARRIPNAEEITAWFLSKHAPIAEQIHQTYQRMVDRGVAFTFRNGDAYTMEIDQGKNVFITADPPYFATTGYNAKDVVKPGMYAATQGLMSRLVEQENNVVYTDEGWWMKPDISTELTDADLVEGAEIATQIANTLDFMVVSGKIDSRYETLGLNNPGGSPIAPRQNANPDGNEGGPDGRDVQPSGRGSDGPWTAGNMATGAVAETGIQPADDQVDPDFEDGAPSWLSSPSASAKRNEEWTPEEIAALQQRYDDQAQAASRDITGQLKQAFTPIDPKNAFDGWKPSPKGENVIYGYRGENGSGSADNNFGSTEGVGLYIAKLKKDAEWFGGARQVAFPQPKRPIVVDEDAGGEVIPMLNEESEVWERILAHKADATDSAWIKAHAAAAKQIGLTEDTWGEKIDQLPRALTDILLQQGYDAVYVRSGGMEWVNILAKANQRFNRTARTPMGQSLYSPSASNPAAEYRYLKAKQEKAGLTPAENEALLRAETAMGQTFAFPMDQKSLAAPRGSVTPRFQPFLPIPRTERASAQQMSLFSPSSGSVDNAGQSPYRGPDEKEIGHRNRPSEGPANLLKSAENLAGGNGGFYFGPERQTAAVQARESQIKALATSPEADPAPTGTPDFIGGEHQVWGSEKDQRVIKRTLPGFYGRTIDEKNLLDSRTFLNRPQLTLRAALPSEYLTRWAILEDIFGLPTSYLGRVGATDPRMAVSQPFIIQSAEDPVTDQDIIALMDAHGFAKVEQGLDAVPELSGVTWYRQKDGVLLADTHARNFRKDASTGTIIPIDLMVTAVPKGASKTLPDPETEWSPAGGASLASPSASAPSRQAVDAALQNLAPIYREVFQASLATPTPTPAQLAATFRVTERAIENIIGTVRTRIRANLETTTPEGLTPQGNTGRPDLGYSTVPSLQRVDQIRAEEGLPLQQTTDEIRSQADQLLQRPNAVRSLIDTEEEWTAVQTAAANIALVNASLKGETSLEVAELAAAYREQGSRWSETGRARQDVHRSPAERHAMLISELLTTPDETAASGIKKAKTKQDRNSILQSWMARVKGIKEAMLNRGIDIDDAFQRLNQQINDAKAAESEASATHRQLVDSLTQRVQDLETSLQQAQSRAQSAATAAQKAIADAEAARAQQALTEAQQAAKQATELDPANTIRLELTRLSKRHRAVVEAMRDGATWDQAAAQTGLTVEEARKVMLGFIGALRKAAIQTLMLAEDMLLGREQTLASPATLPSGAAESRAQRLGRIADALIGAMGYSMDRFDRVSKPTTKTKRQSKQKEADPGPPMMSDEEFTRRQNNPDTHRALWQWEMTATQPQNRISFEEWMARPETKARIERQTRMWALPVSTTTGERSTNPVDRDRLLPTRPDLVSTATGALDMHDPASVLAAARELAATRASKTNKVLEFWRMSILTGFQTSVVNFASNAANSIYNLGPRRIIEAGVNDVLGLIGQGDANSATLGELAVMARQSHKALRLAGQNMLKSWATESRIAESQFAQTLQQMELGSLKGEEIMPALGGKLGLLMRSLSYRHMTAADEFFKGFHGHLEAAAQAHRIAKQEKLTGSAYEARITELMKYGSEAWMRALAVSENVTFQTKLNPKDPRALAVLDKIGAGIRRVSHTKTGEVRQITNEQGKKVMIPVTRPNLLSFFFPFINTPTNIFKSAIEMSPVGALLAIIDGTRALKIKLAKGNMTKQQADLAASELYDRARLVKDVTNQLIATGIFWALSGMVEPEDDEDLPRITGSTDWRSTGKGERDTEMRVMPPMSIRIGKDNFISYSRIEPFATVFASIVDAIHEVSITGMNEKALGNYFTKIENQLDDKTFLSGVSDIINVWRDPERFASKLTSSIVTGFVPNLIRQPIREADPYVRDTKPREQDGFLTAIGKQLGYSLAPGYAPPLMDVWGNPITRHQGQQIGSPATDIMLRVFDPSNIAIGKEIDPIDLYVWNWNRQTQNPKQRLSLEPIGNHVFSGTGADKTKITFTPEEQAEANRNAGKAARAFLGNQWNPQAPTLEGIERIKDTVQRFQRFERDKLRAKKLREAR